MDLNTARCGMLLKFVSFLHDSQTINKVIKNLLYLIKRKCRKKDRFQDKI
jgi:hypothetical protein